MDSIVTRGADPGGGSVLILGGLAGQVDAVRSLQALGWEVHACGREREGPAVTAADGFQVVDIVDVDAVTALAERLGVEFVYSVGSDIAMPTVSRVSERLGLPHLIGSLRTELLRDKPAMRGFLAEQRVEKVEHRRVRTAGDLVAGFVYPAVLKPADSQGQRGIRVVRDHAEALAALPAALAVSPSRTAILEEYLDGPEVSVHVYVRGGNIAFYEPSDRHVWDGPLIGVAQRHVMPSRWVAELGAEHELRSLVTAIVSALGVREGPLYLQLKLTERGPRIIEVAPRLDGCHLWRLIDLLYGVDLLQACWASLAGLEAPSLTRARRGPAGVLRFHLVQPGRPVNVDELRAPTDEPVLFEEFHLDETGAPRDTNGIIARAGYRITLPGSDRT